MELFATCTTPTLAGMPGDHVLIRVGLDIAVLARIKNRSKRQVVLDDGTKWSERGYPWGLAHKYHNGRAELVTNLDEAKRIVAAYESARALRALRRKVHREFILNYDRLYKPALLHILNELAHAPKEPRS